MLTSHWPLAFCDTPSSGLVNANGRRKSTQVDLLNIRHPYWEKKSVAQSPSLDTIGYKAPYK